MTTYSTKNTASGTPGAPLPTTPPRRRPSTAGYWIGAGIAIVATLAAVVWGAFTFLGWRAHVEDFPRVSPPGTAVVSVADTGTRIIYLEHDRATPVPPTPSVTVTAPSGAGVPLAEYRAEMRYDVPGVTRRVGDAVLSFQAQEPGSYQVTVADTEPGAVVAIGDDLVWAWGPQVVGIVALLLGGLLVGLLTVIVTAVRRSGPAT
jgi:hypothetical protein